MAADNLTELVRSRTPDDEVHLIPVIEKELLHYDCLAALEKMGILGELVFHGGTCLRLCYGALRRSEDLDFAYDGDLDELRLDKLGQLLDASIGARFDLKIRIKPPRKTVEFSHAKMQRWWMVVDTAPARPDLPSQRLKIEMVSVETLTREIRRVARNYDYLFPSAGNTLAVCETREEIMADKLVSFVNTPPTYVRKRDLWDLMFLLSRGGCRADQALTMVGKKMELYGCDLGLGEFARLGAERVREIGTSGEFAKEMRRFMPGADFDALFGTEMKREFALNEVADLYRRCG